jgi:hypothetical protein
MEEIDYFVTILIEKHKYAKFKPAQENYLNLWVAIAPSVSRPGETDLCRVGHSRNLLRSLRPRPVRAAKFTRLMSSF